MNLIPAIAKKLKKSRSLSITLSVSFLSLILTSLIISGAIGTFLSFRIQQNIVFSQQKLIAQNAANKVKGFIQEKFTALGTTARLVNPLVTSQKEQYRFLSYLLPSNPSFRQLVLFNSKKQKIIGISRLSKERAGKIEERLEKDLFSQIAQGSNYISSIYVDSVTSEPMVIIGVPVKDVFGDLHGILTAEVNLKFMWDLVESLQIGRSGLAYVVDRRGNLIAFGDIARVLRGENVSDLKAVYEFINQSDPVKDTKPNVFFGINGALVLGVYVSLEMPDWALVTELPVAEAYNIIIQTIITNVILTLIMAALACWIGITLARRLSRPLVNLMDTAARIAGGEFTLEAKVAGVTEISNMAAAFNSMTAQLREVIGNLEKHNKNLQDTVQKYVEYMSKVGNGELDSRLELEEKENTTENPLIILGWQLNDTTENLQRMIDEIKDSTIIIKNNKEKLEIYSKKLEESNKELEQFAYTASHDLQEPLKKLDYYMDRLKTKCSSNVDQKILEYIDRMNNAVVRMEILIRDLLQYSRVTTKAKPFEKVDLNEIIKGVLGDLEIRINETKARINTGNLPIIDAEALQMRQLFQNIIGNSLKYQRENVPPDIIINSKIITDENYCEITVIDNGIGFDNKYAEQIFGLFQRLHGKSEYEGTGIGLAVCKKIVEKHGGIISADGKEGEGSAFYIKLPLVHIATD